MELYPTLALDPGAAVIFVPFFIPYQKWIVALVDSLAVSLYYPDHLTPALMAPSRDKNKKSQDVRDKLDKFRNSAIKDKQPSPPRENSVADSAPDGQSQ